MLKTNIHQNLAILNTNMFSLTAAIKNIVKFSSQSFTTSYTTSDDTTSHVNIPRPSTLFPYIQLKSIIQQQLSDQEELQILDKHLGIIAILTAAIHNLVNLAKQTYKTIQDFILEATEHVSPCCCNQVANHLRVIDEDVMTIIISDALQCLKNIIIGICEKMGTLSKKMKKTKRTPSITSYITCSTQMIHSLFETTTPKKHLLNIQKSKNLT